MKMVAVCGVGALGSHLALFVRNEAFLRLIDFDRVESKNLLAQAYVKAVVGKNKAEALRLSLQNFYQIKAEARPVRLEGHNVEVLVSDVDLVVEAFDNPESRRCISNYARSQQIPLLHLAISGDGTVGLVRWDARFEPDEAPSPGQATCEGGEHLPLIASIAAAGARAVQDFLSEGLTEDRLVRLDGTEIIRA